MKRPKLVRDDSGERQGWWLGDRFVPDTPPEAREWHEERKARAALEQLVKHLGEMPHDWPSRELYLAYSAAENLLRPDEFTERFMGRCAKAESDRANSENNQVPCTE